MWSLLILGVAFLIAVGFITRGCIKGDMGAVGLGFLSLFLGVGVFFVEFLALTGRVGLAIGVGVAFALMAAAGWGLRAILVGASTGARRPAAAAAAATAGDDPAAADAAAERPSGWYGYWPSRGAEATRTTALETRYFRMTLDHDSGALSGKILFGPLQGHGLAELPLDQLIRLYEECQTGDEQSAMVLEAWLDRNVREDWRAVAAGKAAGAGAADGNGADGPTMSRDEARLILGVGADAPAKAIKDAHRRLMQRMHPDHGGSTYLAAKINEARDLLLGSAGRTA